MGYYNPDLNDLTKNDLTIKEKIIKTLLESNKTTGEIAITLGYSDENGHVKYNNVGDDLDSLEEKGFIRGSKLITKKPGKPPTNYEILYYKSVLIELLKEYPSLLSDLQKSGQVISLLSNEFNDMDTHGFFDWWLAISPGFFKLFLTNNHAAIIDQGKKIYLYTEGTKLLESDNIISTSISPPIDSVLLSAMLHCILNDILDDEATPEAIELLRKFKIIDFEFDRRMSDELLDRNKKTDVIEAVPIIKKFGFMPFMLANRRRLFRGDVAFNFEDFYFKKPQC